MNIEKRASGSYRARKTINGKSINVTFDHKPTEKEIMIAFAEKMSEQEAKESITMSFRTCCEKYNESKSAVLSPNTLRSYNMYVRYLPEWFLNAPISSIEQIHINKLINGLVADKKAPKTIANYHGYISAVLSTYRPDMKINTTLPQREKYKPYEPSKEDVKKVMEYFKEHYPDDYIPLVLCSCGLRKGEMLALQVSDIENDIIHITKSKALDKDNNWVTKAPKTTDSERDVMIPHEISEMIRERGYVYKGDYTRINKRLDVALKKLGIPHFTIHILRHFFAAVLSEKYDEATVLELGGWSTPYVMKRAYRYSIALKEEDKKREAMQSVTNIFLS